MGNQLTRRISVIRPAIFLLSFLALFVLGLGLGRIWDQWSGEPSYLEYVVTAYDGVASRANGDEDETVLRIGDEDYDNVSVVGFSLFNLSNRDYEDLELVLTFTVDGSDKHLLRENILTGQSFISSYGAHATVSPAEQRSRDQARDSLGERLASGSYIEIRLDPTEANQIGLQASIDELIAESNARVADQFQTAMQLSSSITPSDDYGVRFERRYRVAVANRSDQAILTAEFVFEGDTAPEVEVDLIAPGLVARELELPLRGAPQLNWPQVVRLGIPALVLVIVLIYFLSPAMRASSVWPQQDSGD